MTTAATYENELNVAIEAAAQAAYVCREVQQNLVTAATLEKKDRSPVTVADFASQAVICSALRGAFPRDLVVGEEDAKDLRDAADTREKVVGHVRGSLGGNLTEDEVLDAIDHGGGTPDASTERFWTLDPIDGTKGFLRGEQYAIALALIEDGKVAVGVLVCPNFGEQGTIFSAVRKQGASERVLFDHAQGNSAKAVSVKYVACPTEARFCESVESGHTDQSQSGLIAAELGITAEPVRMDSQAKYAAVARGDASIYLRLPTRKGYQEKIWDHAAGMLVTQEAGGTVTDITGKPLDFNHGRTLAQNKGVIATGGNIHDQVVAAVQAQFAPPE